MDLRTPQFDRKCSTDIETAHHAPTERLNGPKRFTLYPAMMRRRALECRVLPRAFQISWARIRRIRIASAAATRGRRAMAAPNLPLRHYRLYLRDISAGCSCMLDAIPGFPYAMLLLDTLCFGTQDMPDSISQTQPLDLPSKLDVSTVALCPQTQLRQRPLVCSVNRKGM